MEAPKKKLHKRLSEDGLYSKSFQEFEQQYSTPEKQEKLYERLNSDGLYTKSKEEFISSIFPVKKKDVSVSTSPKQKPASVTKTGSSDILPSQTSGFEDVVTTGSASIQKAPKQQQPAGDTQYAEGSMAWTQQKLKQSDPQYAQL